MTKKSLLIILGLSFVLTYAATFIEVLLSGNVVAGKSGFPLRFGSSSLFGGSSTNYTMLLLNIAFWFIVIWGIWKVLQRTKSKK